MSRSARLVASATTSCAVFGLVLVRLGRLPRALDDLVGLRPRLLQALAVLGQDLIGFRARALGRVDRLFDRLLAAPEGFADAWEGELGEQEHRDAEDEQRPDHQPDAGFDQEAALGGEHAGGGGDL